MCGCWFIRLSNFFNSLLKLLLFHPKLMLLGISCNPVQGYRVILLDIYNLLIQHWLTLHGCTGHLVPTLYAWWWRAPDLLLTVLILGVTSCINSFSTVENWMPPHLWGAGVHSLSKFHMDDTEGGNLIIPPMLQINPAAKHYSNQKHNLLNVCIHQPCHLC